MDIKSLTGSVAKLTAAKVAAEKYLETLNELRPWWPVLLPFLAWGGRRAYRKERQHMRKEAIKAQRQTIEQARKDQAAAAERAAKAAQVIAAYERNKENA